MQKACQFPECGLRAGCGSERPVEDAPVVKNDVTTGAWRLSAQAARRSL